MLQTTRRVSVTTPLISCICPTYNRPPSHQHLIEEAIESFLRQDYPNKEMLILNDTPGQELYCDAPGVVVVDVEQRFPTLGEKCNAAVRMSRGDLIAPWDDDDISLPWRLSLSLEKLGDGGVFNPRAYWFMAGNTIKSDHTVGYAHNASLFTRAAFEKAGGYRAISSGYDRDIDTAFSREIKHMYDPVRRRSPKLEKTEWSYIYRWGVSRRHVSAGGGDEGSYPQIGAQQIVEGRFRLQPGWQQDYVQLTQSALESPPD